MREIPERIDTTFRFVLLVANRAEQLMRGAVHKLEPRDRPTRQALKEIDQGIVAWEYGPAPAVEPVATEGDEEAKQAEVQ